MKKIFTLALFISLCQFMFAQSTRIKVESWEGNPAQQIEIYLGSKWMGVTDSLGTVQWNQIVDLADLRLFQNGIEYTYEIKYSNIVNEPEAPREYVLLITVESIEAAVVRASRAGEKEPFAKTEIKKSQIEVQNTGRDLPILLQYQPSVITTSDAGNGVGYTGIRIRGTDASRTNITVNGVPINDAESQGTFWVNMPDLSSSIQNIQIQRGAGSSTTGTGVFGANVNIQTASSLKPYGTVSQSYGSYNTRKSTVAAGTGLLNQHWTIDFRLSQIHSDGFIDRAKSDLNSYFISSAYISNTWSVKLLHFAGAEKTYQAWYGIPREKLLGPDTALRDQYNRNVGFLYQTTADSVNLFTAGKRNYNYYLYENETDNYSQAHTHLYFNVNLGKRDKFVSTLYRTNGQGFFEQYKNNDKLENYQLPNVIYGNDTIVTSDIIRQRWLQNTLTGWIANWMHDGEKWKVTAGGGYSQYLGNHFGKIVWARTAPSVNHLAHYYDAIGDKYDGNLFMKVQYPIHQNVTVFGDFQLRRVFHTGRGMDNDLRRIQFDGNYLFYNQKLGVTLDLKSWGTAYGSYSILNKEPSRSDFTDVGNGTVPKPESMNDIELGWKLNKNKLYVECDGYLMDYKNQLILTGAVNDVGTPLRRNVERSHRAGVELMAVYAINTRWQVGGNLTLSTNRIRKIVTEVVDYSDNSVVSETLTHVPIAYAPNAVAAVSITWKPTAHWNIIWNHKYVGKQFLDNTGNTDKMMDAYYFSELWINKSWNISGSVLSVKFQVLNLFNNLYNNNGYTYEYYYGKTSLTREVYLFPSAPRNFMASIALNF